MDTHEYQAKELLKQYGVPIPKFGVASCAKEALKIAEDLQLSEGVIKIQVHAGGRGKQGGVQFARSKEEIVKVTDSLIGMKIVNAQTGPQGIVAHQVLVSEPIQIVQEFYLGATIDRESATPILMASSEGGVDIEEVARKDPTKIVKVPIGLSGKVKPYHLLRLGKSMGWKEDLLKQGMEIASRVAQAFIETDSSLIEINPLALSDSGQIWALDAKCSIDDNALFRQKEIASFYDPTQLSSNEVAAKKEDLSYIALSGEIGCMVNGAGLAMATMDCIQFYGGRPANFLDVGGSATKEKIAKGFKIILSDPHVKAILVNIFGGIMNCVTIAEGVIAASKELEIQVPLIVRLEGTNVKEGSECLNRSGLSIISAKGLEEAARKAVDSIQKEK